MEKQPGPFGKLVLIACIGGAVFIVIILALGVANMFWQ